MLHIQDPEFVIAVVAVILGAALLQANVYVLLRYLKGKQKLFDLRCLLLFEIGAFVK